MFSLPFIYESKRLTKLRGSCGHRQQLKNLNNRGLLNSKLFLTMTLVTGSWENTKQVNKYYKNHFNMVELTDMHAKLRGSVARFSKVFNTTFIEYKCADNQNNLNLKCFATLSEVTVPVVLTSAFLGIIGLVRVLTLMTSNY